ncbi:hypothetical protein WJX73_010501 [Symbiochloris irregularis]|uniref:Uncharacterized protein n=1 Tax=Symbiochloris irregularis TaxID=706552 RepID=A0AAW1NU08_9CHLO
MFNTLSATAAQSGSPAFASPATPAGLRATGGLAKLATNPLITPHGHQMSPVALSSVPGQEMCGFLPANNPAHQGFVWQDNPLFESCNRRPRDGTAQLYQKLLGQRDAAVRAQKKAETRLKELQGDLSRRTIGRMCSPLQAHIEDQIFTEVRARRTISSADIASH